VSSSPAPTSLQEVTVGDVMRPATTTVETDAHLASVAYLMKRAGDSALVVMPEDGVGGPVAVITDAHITQAVADGRDLDETRINQLGLPRPPRVDRSMPVVEAAERMLTDRLEHLPIVDDERLLGLVDMAAVCRTLLRHADG
jgi:signal-transduction protein with cAMP-binding, CBS, and nucleotidyltransferase domain